MEKLWGNHSLLEIAGIQWNRCMVGMHKALDELESGPYFQVRYEEIAQEPEKHLINILDFMECTYDNSLISVMKTKISSKSCGRWKQDITPEEQVLLMSQIREGLSSYGYLFFDGLGIFMVIDCFSPRDRTLKLSISI